MTSRFYYWLAMVGYFGLFLLLITWHGWLVPSEKYPVSLVLIVYVGPLLIPLRGLLHGKLYTHAWVHFMALFYFMSGVGTIAASEQERYFAIAQVTFCVMLFLGSMLFVRKKAREMRAENEEAETEETKTEEK